MFSCFRVFVAYILTVARLPILSLFAVVLGGTLLAATQQTVDSRTALVTVSDTRNRVIVDLGPDDFVITERGQAREILDARMADYPVVVLIDTGGAARENFEDIRKAVTQFIGRLGQRPISVATLSEPSTMLATFDDDRRVALERLQSLAVNAEAGMFALNAAAAAARPLRDAGSRFAAIVVVSASPTDESPDDPELVAPIIDSGAVVHAIVNRANPQTPLAGAMEMIRRLSDQTHGQFTPIYSSASYQVALTRLADRLASEMIIEYIVPPRSPATDVQVGVKIPGARARGLGVRPR
jgi:hypothetical protein